MAQDGISLKMWLNQGEPVHWQRPWDMIDRARRKLKISAHPAYGVTAVPGRIPAQALILAEILIIEERVMSKNHD